MYALSQTKHKLYILPFVLYINHLLKKLTFVDIDFFKRFTHTVTVETLAQFYNLSKRDW